MSATGLGIFRPAGRLARQGAPDPATGAGLALVDRADAAAHADEWSALAAVALGDNPYFSPDFVIPALAHLYPGVDVAFVRSADGALAAVAPIAGGRLGRIAPAARIWSTHFGPLGAPLVGRRQIERTLATLIDGAAPAKSLIVPDLPLDDVIAGALIRAAEAAGRPTAIVSAHVRAMLDRESGVTDPRAALPTRRRKEYARQFRRLADLGPVVIETADTPALVRARFEEFLALEAASWKGRRGTALAGTAATVAFAREAVFNFSASGAARIVSIRLGDRAIAMVVAFIAGATAYTWKIAHDEAYARYSPGAQAMLEAGRSLFLDPRIARIDSCAIPDHPMIDHLWRDRRAIGTLVIGPQGGGPLFSLGLALTRLEHSARMRIRRFRARRHANRAVHDNREPPP
jgi:CelD/BcsL family acetyltransferase involved in cellulose biosynthesis